MDSRKPLTAGEIEEIKALVGNHYTTWESDDKEAAATYLLRLLSLLTPPPDAAVREAVEQAELKLDGFPDDFEDTSLSGTLDMVRIRPHTLRTILRAVQTPRLTTEQVEAVKNINRKTESRQCICGDGYLCARCEILGELSEAFPEAFAGEATDKSVFECLVGLTFTKSEDAEDE